MSYMKMQEYKDNEETENLPVDGSYEDEQNPQQKMISPPVYVINRSQPLGFNAPKDYFWCTIFVTICCLFPIGIPAIFKSLEVQRYSRLGDLESAVEASRQAKRLTVISALFGLLFIVLMIIMGVIELYTISMLFQHQLPQK